MIGSQDGITLTSETMYAETEDQNYPDADEILYPQYGLGNQFFESTITSTTSGSYGLPEEQKRNGGTTRRPA
jgi:hypothetical protein